MKLFDAALTNGAPLLPGLYVQLQQNYGPMPPPPGEQLWVEDLSHAQMVTEDGLEDYAFVI
jgi:hypothetical protein